MNAADLVKAGNLKDALEALTQNVRDEPANAANRTFLFQLLSVLGNWDRALTQLNVVADLDNDALLMAQTYRELLQCEAFRSEVFQGKRQPLLFGEPNEWLGILLQASQRCASGNGKEARECVMSAMDLVPARSGKADDKPFTWISDADMRLGPVFEMVLNGKYYWVPMDSVAEIRLSEPEDLRDLVWLPINIKWVNDGDSIGFMPTRYPGAGTVENEASAMARRTDWTDVGNEFFVGSGQRMFTTDVGEISFLETRHITFDTASNEDTSAVMNGRA